MNVIEIDTISQKRTFHIRIANVNFRINGYYALISFISRLPIMTHVILNRLISHTNA